MIHQVLVFLLFTTISFGLVPIQHKEYEHVPGEYVVTYNFNTTKEEATAHFQSLANLGVEFLGTYNGVYHKGFAAKIPEDLLLPLQQNPMILSIEVNRIFHLHSSQQSCGGTTPLSPSWGLSRISYNGDMTAGLPTRFLYAADGGAGTTVYVLDTGILTKHVQFGDRASFGVNYSDDLSEVDGNGHGTHCAGTIGGSTFGVAKQVKLVAVKVLNSGGGGTLAGIINGVNWVINSAVARKSVISMSLGASGIHTSLEVAINAAVAADIAVVVAAGNNNMDACGFSPAGFPSCITVGATELSSDRIRDSRSSYSNWGTCVDLFAPGTNILSAWIGSNTATNTISGTSMACPHVAGLSAVLLGTLNLAPKDLETALVQTYSQSGRISNVGTGSPNLLLYNGC